MQQLVIGNLVFNVQGAWDSSVAYPALSWVTHKGSSWYTTEATIAGQEPGVNAVWNLGAQGTTLSDALDGTGTAADGVAASEWALGQVNATATEAASAIAISQQYMHVQEQQPNDTHGGSSVALNWMTRNLNTVVHNSIDGASLGSDNSITLPIGRYEIHASAPVYRAGHSRMTLFTEGGNTLATSTAAHSSNDPVNAHDRVLINAIIDLQAIQKIYLLQIFEIAHPDTGLGVGGNFTPGVNVFAEIFIRRIS